MNTSNRTKTASSLSARILVGSIATLLSSHSAHAAAGTWFQTLAGTYNWSDATQWGSGAGPVADGATFNAAFNNVAGGDIITTLDTARTIGGISRGGTGTGTQANWTITSASNLLTLDNGASNVGIANNVNAISVLTVDTDLLLLSNLVLSGNGNNNAGITLGSVVGVHTITGAKNITLANSNSNGAGAITINDNISTSGAIINTSTFGKNHVIAGVIGSTVTGVTQTGGLALTLTGANLYTGATTVGTAGSAAKGGTLTVSGANGSISASTVITVNGTGSQLNLDYVGVANGAVDRIGNVAVTLNYGGELRMNGATAASTSSSESFGTLTLGFGNGIVTITNGGSGTSTDTLTASGFARGSSFATALVRGSNMGLSGNPNTKLVLTSQTGLTQIGTNTSAAGIDTGTVKNLTIVPYIIGATAVAGVGTNFVTYDTTSGLRRLGTNEQSAVISGATGDNVRAAAGANAVTGAKVFNSLLLSSGGTGATPGTATSSVTGDGNSLTLTSGALANVATSATGNATVSGFSSIIFGTSGANEAVITNTNVTAGGTLTIDSGINTSTAGGGLTKAGGGLVVLSASNLYTGQTTVNQGTLQIGAGTAGDLGSNTANIVLNGGSLTFGRTNAGLTLSNTISGIGTVTQNGTGGTTVLSGPNNYTGTTFINSGTLALSGGNNRIASGNTVSFDGVNGSTATLDIGSTSQTLGTITFPSSALGTAGTSLTANITGSGGTLLVNGAANLQFGPVQVSAPGLVTVNMTGLSNFEYNAPLNTFRVGIQTTATSVASVDNATQVATVTLASNNTITAAVLGIGDASTSGGGGKSTLNLGQANTLNVGDINMGAASAVAANGRASSTLTFAAGLTNPTVTIRNTDASSAIGTWTVGEVNQPNSGTAPKLTYTSSVDFSTGILDAKVTTLTIGKVEMGNTAASRAGFSIGTFTVGATTGADLTVGTLNIGLINGTVTPQLGSNGAGSTGTFTMNNAGGTLKATTINLATNTIVDASANSKTVSGTFNLTDGTLTATTIQKGDQTGGTATVTTAFNWATGTIGNIAGGDLAITSVPITLLTSASHTFNISGSNTATVDANSPISGLTFGITKAGTGILVLSATNTYSGKTVVEKGTLSFSTGNATATANQQLGASADLDLGAATSSGTLNYTGAAGTFAKNINALGNGTDTVKNSGTGLLTLSGTLTKDGTTLTLNGGANGIAVTGQILGASPNSDLIVTGGNTTVSNINTYAGATTVSAGTLEVTGSLTGTSGVTVNTGGTLLLNSAASDIVKTTATVTAGGGTVAFGNAANQVQTFGALTLNANLTLDFGAGGVGVSGNDKFSFAGFVHTAGTGVLSINNWSGNLAGATGNIDGNDDRLVFTGSFTDFTTAFNQADVSFNGGSGYAAIDFGSTYEIVPVPEPATTALIGAVALCALIGYRERRRMSRKTGAKSA